MKRISTALFILLFFIVTACDTTARVYEKDIEFPYEMWKVDNIPNFEFEIQDPNQTYDLSLNIRNGIDFPFQNVYVAYHLLNDKGEELATAMPNFHLFDAKTGKPKGIGYGDVYDVQKNILEDYKFAQAGKYKLTVKQMMRVDDLEGIRSIGLKIVPSHQENK